MTREYRTIFIFLKNKKSLEIVRWQTKFDLDMSQLPLNACRA